MKPVRVMHISPAHPPTDPRIVHKQVPALAEQYDVICLLPNAGGQTLGRVRFIGLPFFAWLGWRLLFVHPLILGHILRLRPAILHIYMPELLPVALLCRWFGVKIIYEVQENLRLKFDRKPRNNHRVFRWAFAFFDRQARRYCYHVFTEDSYLKTYSDLRLPCVVIHNYPDPAFFDAIPRPGTRSPPVNDGPHLLYVGVVSVDRGLAVMIQAIALLKESYPAIRLHLFGRCAFDPAALRALPSYRHVRDNLTFYGHTDLKIAYADPKRYVAGLALLRPVGDYPDSFPTKLFEYMALGLPVITSDFPLYRSIVEPARCGYCVEPTNAAAVADCMMQVIDNPAEANAMGQRGRQAVEHSLNWQTEANQLLRFYQKIVLTQVILGLFQCLVPYFLGSV